MNKVSQEDPAGCAIASVACALEFHTEKQKNFLKTRCAHLIGYSCEEIVDALKNFAP